MRKHCTPFSNIPWTEQVALLFCSFPLIHVSIIEWPGKTRRVFVFIPLCTNVTAALVAGKTLPRICECHIADYSLIFHSTAILLTERVVVQHQSGDKWKSFVAPTSNPTQDAFFPIPSEAHTITLVFGSTFPSVGKSRVRTLFPSM